MTDRLQTAKVLSRGGLYTNEDFLALSDTLPGAATGLVNFEVGQYGGYRRVSGYKYLDSSYGRPAGTGKALGVFIMMALYILLEKKHQEMIMMFLNMFQVSRVGNEQV